MGPKAVNKFAIQPQFGSVFVEGTLFGAVAKGCQKDSHFGAFPYDTYTYLRSLSINISYGQGPSVGPFRFGGGGGRDP